jgi:small subunit ribosomal protein S6
MRDYEVVYIFRSALPTEDIEARVEKFHERILSASGAEITAVENWGKRELAYPIDDQRSGTYVVAQFTAPADVLPPFERALKLDEDLLRHLVVLSEGELATPPSLRHEDDDDDDDGGRRRRDEDDDDDDDDDVDDVDEEDEDED